MGTEKYHDELWDEMPLTAYAALGRRGREAFDLKGCFNPQCGIAKENEVHVLKEFTEEIPGSDSSWKTEIKRYLIYCEKCQSKFNLVYERKIDNTRADEDTPEMGVFMESVRASNEDNSVNYGEIGHVQSQ